MKRQALDVVFRLREIERRLARNALARSLRLEHQACVAQIDMAAGILAEVAFIKKSETVASSSLGTPWFLQTQSSHAVAATVHAAAQAATRLAVANLAKSQSALRVASLALDQRTIQQHGELVSHHQRELDDLRHDPVP